MLEADKLSYRQGDQKLACGTQISDSMTHICINHRGKMKNKYKKKYGWMTLQIILRIDSLQYMHQGNECGRNYSKYYSSVHQRQTSAQERVANIEVKLVLVNALMDKKHTHDWDRDIQKESFKHNKDKSEILVINTVNRFLGEETKGRPRSRDLNGVFQSKQEKNNMK